MEGLHSVDYGLHHVTALSHESLKPTSLSRKTKETFLTLPRGLELRSPHRSNRAAVGSAPTSSKVHSGSSGEGGLSIATQKINLSHPKTSYSNHTATCSVRRRALPVCSLQVSSIERLPKLAEVSELPCNGNYPDDGEYIPLEAAKDPDEMTSTKDSRQLEHSAKISFPVTNVPNKPVAPATLVYNGNISIPPGRRTNDSCKTKPQYIVSGLLSVIEDYINKEIRMIPVLQSNAIDPASASVTQDNRMEILKIYQGAFRIFIGGFESCAPLLSRIMSAYDSVIKYQSESISDAKHDSERENTVEVVYQSEIARLEKCIDDLKREVETQKGDFEKTLAKKEEELSVVKGYEARIRDFTSQDDDRTKERQEDLEKMLTLIRTLKESETRVRVVDSELRDAKIQLERVGLLRKTLLSTQNELDDLKETYSTSVPLSVYQRVRNDMERQLGFKDLEIRQLRRLCSLRSSEMDVMHLKMNQLRDDLAFEKENGKSRVSTPRPDWKAELSLNTEDGEYLREFVEELQPVGPSEANFIPNTPETVCSSRQIVTLLIKKLIYLQKQLADYRRKEGTHLSLPSPVFTTITAEAPDQLNNPSIVSVAVVDQNTSIGNNTRNTGGGTTPNSKRASATPITILGHAEPEILPLPSYVSLSHGGIQSPPLVRRLSSASVNTMRKGSLHSLKGSVSLAALAGGSNYQLSISPMSPAAILRGLGTSNCVPPFLRTIGTLKAVPLKVEEVRAIIMKLSASLFKNQAEWKNPRMRLSDHIASFLKNAADDPKSYFGNTERFGTGPWEGGHAATPAISLGYSLISAVKYFSGGLGWSGVCCSLCRWFIGAIEGFYPVQIIFDVLDNVAIVRDNIIRLGDMHLRARVKRLTVMESLGGIFHYKSADELEELRAALGGQNSVEIESIVQLTQPFAITCILQDVQHGMILHQRMNDSLCAAARHYKDIKQVDPLTDEIIMTDNSEISPEDDDRVISCETVLNIAKSIEPKLPQSVLDDLVARVITNEPAAPSELLPLHIVLRRITIAPIKRYSSASWCNGYSYTVPDGTSSRSGTQSSSQGEGK